MSEGVVPVELLVTQSVTTAGAAGGPAWRGAAGLPERGAPGRLLIRLSSASPMGIRGRGASTGAAAGGAAAPKGISTLRASTVWVWAGNWPATWACAAPRKRTDASPRRQSDKTAASAADLVSGRGALRGIGRI